MLDTQFATLSSRQEMINDPIGRSASERTSNIFIMPIRLPINISFWLINETHVKEQLSALRNVFIFSPKFNETTFRDPSSPTVATSVSKTDRPVHGARSLLPENLCKSANRRFSLRLLLGRFRLICSNVRDPGK